MTRRLESESRAKDCKALENKLKSAVDAVLVEYKGRQADYDLETDFGRARGTSVL